MGTVPADGFITHEALIALLDASPDGIMLVAADGHVKFSNIAAQRLFGHSREQMLGTPVESLIPARYRGHHVDHRTEYAQQARPRPMGLGLRLHGLRRDGSEFPVEISLAPMEADGETLTVAIVRDATEQRLDRGAADALRSLAGRRGDRRRPRGDRLGGDGARSRFADLPRRARGGIPRLSPAAVAQAGLLALGRPPRGPHRGADVRRHGARAGHVRARVPPDRRRRDRSTRSATSSR